MDQAGPEIRTRMLADGVAIEAVVVDRGVRRYWWILVLFALMFGFPAGVGFFGGMMRIVGSWSANHLIDVLILVPFLLTGVVAGLVGLWFRWGVWEVEVGRQRLSRVIRLGGLRWSRGMPIGEVSSVELKDADVTDDSGRSMDTVLLIARRMNARKPLYLAWAKRDRMVRVAELVGQALRAPELVRDETRVTELEGIDDAAERGELLAPPDLPSGSRITWNQTPDGVTVMLPRLGLMKSNGGLLFMALVWNLIAFGVGGTFMVLFVSQWKWILLMPTVVGGLFILIGVWLMRMAIARGTRRAIVDVVGDALMITQQTAFGESVDQWEGNVRAVRAEPSGESINERPILHLAIEAEGREKKGFFKERSDEELKWLAAMLRNALGVGGGGAR